MARDLPDASVRARLLATAAGQRATPPGTWRRRVTVFGAGSFIWLAGATVALGLRQDWSALAPMSLAATLGTLLGVALCASCAGMTRGRAMGGASSGWLIPVALGSVAVLLALLVMVDPIAPATAVVEGWGHALSPRGARCFMLTAAIALPPLALALAVPRGLMMARPLLAGTCLGLGAATWGHAVVRAHCAVGGAAHALLGHLLPAVPIMLLGALVMWWAQRRQIRAAARSIHR